jgi:hypothetical protein
MHPLLHDAQHLIQRRGQIIDPHNPIPLRIILPNTLHARCVDRDISVFWFIDPDLKNVGRHARNINVSNRAATETIG